MESMFFKEKKKQTILRKAIVLDGSSLLFLKFAFTHELLEEP